MASLSIPYSFTNNTVASATEVNANFTSVKSFAESSVVQVDGSVQANTAAIANLAVTTGKIADGAITTAKIADGAVVLADLAAAVQAFLVPVGTIAAFGSATPPSGWLLCNGQSTSTYTALAAVVGATVPDLRGRTIIGTGTGTGLTARTINATGGSETHTLSAAELAAHNHSISHDHTPADGLGINTGTESHNHAHAYQASVVGSGTLANAADTSVDYGYVNTAAYTEAQNIAHRHNFFIPAYSGVSSTAGSGSAHNNMQPFYALNYIIKH